MHTHGNRGPMAMHDAASSYRCSTRPTLVRLWIVTLPFAAKRSGFTFRVVDLEKGPILIPEHGVFIAKAGSGITARQFAKELAAKNLKSVCPDGPRTPRGRFLG